MNNLFDIKDKIALITGSGRGIGLTLARGLGQAGCRVVLSDIDENQLMKSVKTLNDEGISAFGSVFDVRDEEGIQKAVGKINQDVGSIDILINNAGIQIRGPLEEFKLQDWQRILDINLTGAFLTAKAVVPDMIKRQSGKIINICSIQSELARPTIAPYTAAKGGLKLLTRGMATDWGKYNIQANGIAPGYFKTEMTKSLYENKEFDAWLCARVPADRWGNPEELLGAAIFLSAQASSYVNGQTFFVDGGLSACV
jgi:gluconate 5-dehydrogenase